jgi:tRNA-uridine 2-sulfurtransferase
VNWLTAPPKNGLLCTVKLRAREEPHAATVHTTQAGAEVRLDVPALPAPGQACVFYHRDRVLGGGIIRRPDLAAMVDGARGPGLSPLPFGSDGGVAQR